MTASLVLFRSPYDLVTMSLVITRALSRGWDEDRVRRICDYLWLRDSRR